MGCCGVVGEVLWINQAVGARRLSVRPTPESTYSMSSSCPDILQREVLVPPPADCYEPITSGYFTFVQVS